ncbi:HAD-IIIA family hydrolase [Cohnella lubricantis]|uniref:KdsC family phosphatase n=1 Tax=Cohnella lubricantis TaxID=2163172 RepID=UPI00315AB545
MCDVDGVLTDGRMIYTEKGDEIKQFHVRDGLAAEQLRAHGYRLGILSSGHSKQAITKRFSQQGFEFISIESSSKLSRFRDFLERFNVDPSEVIYIGDDINDIEVMRLSRISICPKDAHTSVIDSVDWVLNSNGGNGCLREVSDFLLSGVMKD